jgi:aquaporin Z
MRFKLTAEFLGTFWLVLGGCGAALFAAVFPHTGIGFLGVALAFGLSVVTMAYAVGHISGAHFNPAVTVGIWCAGRMPLGEALAYIVVQVLGGIGAAALIAYIASGSPDVGAAAIGKVANGYGDQSPGHYGLSQCLVTEAVMTFFFLMVILGVTLKRAPTGFAPLAIGLTLTLIHLISIPVTKTSVNPARSTGPALIAGGIALTQLWLFWVAPVIGAAIAGRVHRWLEPAG